MDERETHYQISFTTRQALGLFVGVALALGLAYFFGLMTGLSGRRPEEAGASSPPASPAPRTSAPSEPPRVAALESPMAGPSRTILYGAAAPAPTAEPGPRSLQLFEDRGEAEPSPTPGHPAPTRVAIRAGEFWVQVISVTTEREAKAVRERLRAHEFRAAILSAEGPKGTLYRVRVGPYATREEASAVAARLKVREKVEPWIVPAGH